MLKIWLLSYYIYLSWLQLLDWTGVNKIVTKSGKLLSNYYTQLCTIDGITLPSGESLCRVEMYTGSVLKNIQIKYISYE
jgi:hypothetical protein